MYYRRRAASAQINSLSKSDKTTSGNPQLLRRIAPKPAGSKLSRRMIMSNDAL